MDFKDKYSNVEDEKKMVISNDAYALGETMEQLIKALELLRQRLKR